MLSTNHLQIIIKPMIKSSKKLITTLEEANRRIINYENEIAYCDRIIESLYEYIIEVKLTKIKTNKILDEIKLWKKRRDNYFYHVNTLCA